MIAILMSAKWATPGLLRIKVFRNKGYDVMISVQDATKNLSHDSKYLVDLVMWPKSHKYTFLMREIIVILIL